MTKNLETQSSHDRVYLHFNHKVVKDRVIQAIYQPRGLKPEEEKELLAYADLVEISAYIGTLPIALQVLGEFIKYSDSLIGSPQDPQEDSQ